MTDKTEKHEILQGEIPEPAHGKPGGNAGGDPDEVIRLDGAGDLSRFFAKGPLLPAVVQERRTGQVLMLAYMNEESLRRTLESGYTWFYSRSRRELWNKGATSGHVQRVLEIRADCDDDTLLVLVEQTGAACHTGHRSCFFTSIWRADAQEE